MEIGESFPRAELVPRLHELLDCCVELVAAYPSRPPISTSDEAAAAGGRPRPRSAPADEGDEVDGVPGWRGWVAAAPTATIGAAARGALTARQLLAVAAAAPARGRVA